MKILMEEIKDSNINPINVFNDLDNFSPTQPIAGHYNYPDLYSRYAELNNEMVYGTYREGEIPQIFMEVMKNMTSKISEEKKQFWVNIYKKLFLGNNISSMYNFKIISVDQIINRLLFIDKFNEYFPEITIEQLKEYEEIYENKQKTSKLK